MTNRLSLAKVFGIQVSQSVSLKIRSQIVLCLRLLHSFALNKLNTKKALRKTKVNAKVSSALCWPRYNISYSFTVAPLPCGTLFDLAFLVRQDLGWRRPLQGSECVQRKLVMFYDFLIWAVTAQCRWALLDPFSSTPPDQRAQLETY